MTAVTAVVNQKGGVGKTTISELCGQYMSLVKKLRSAVGDLDIQCNYTDGAIGMEPDDEAIGGQLPPKHPAYEPDSNVLERSSIADCFWGHGILPFETWINEKTTNSNAYLDVFAGHPERLEQINATFSNKDDYISPDALNRLREFLHCEDFFNMYEYIGLDLGPSRNAIFRSALRAATHVIIPFEPEEKPIQGINAMLQIIRQENYSRPNDIPELKIIGLLPNKVRNTKVHSRILAQIKEHHEDLLFPEECWLSLLTAFPDRDMKDARPKSIFELPDSSLAKKQALSMCEFVYQSIYGEDA